MSNIEKKLAYFHSQLCENTAPIGMMLTKRKFGPNTIQVIAEEMIEFIGDIDAS